MKQTAIFHPVMRITTNRQRCYDSHTGGHTTCETWYDTFTGWSSKVTKGFRCRVRRGLCPAGRGHGDPGLLLRFHSSPTHSCIIRPGEPTGEPRHQTEPEGKAFGWQPSVRPGTLLLSHVLYARAQREKLLPPTVCPATCTRLQSWGTKLSPLQYLRN